MKRKKYIKNLMSKGLPRNTAYEFTKQLRFWHIPYQCCAVGFVYRISDGLFHMKCTIPMRYASNVFLYNRTLKENHIWLPEEREIGFNISREEYANPGWRNSPLRQYAEEMARPYNKCMLQLICSEVTN